MNALSELANDELKSDDTEQAEAGKKKFNELDSLAEP